MSGHQRPQLGVMLDERELLGPRVEAPHVPGLADHAAQQTAGLFDHLVGAQLTIPTRPKPGGIVYTGKHRMLQPPLWAAT
jgi:hypothetical protein